MEERGEGRFVHVPTGDSVERIGAKMSKSLRNVVTPDDVVAQYGSDAFRVCLMFMGPVEGGRVWETEKAAASLKFLRRVWNYAVSGIASPAETENSAVTIAIGKLVEAVTEDLENLRLNTAIAELMKFLNAAEGQPVTKAGLETFLRVLAPFAPHMAEELWERAGQKGSVFHADWPKADTDMLRAAVETIEIVVQRAARSAVRFTSPPVQMTRRCARPPWRCWWKRAAMWRALTRPGSLSCATRRPAGCGW